MLLCCVCVCNQIRFLCFYYVLNDFQRALQDTNKFTGFRFLENFIKLFVALRLGSPNFVYETHIIERNHLRLSNIHACMHSLQTSPTSTQLIVKCCFTSQICVSIQIVSKSVYKPIKVVTVN